MYYFAQAPRYMVDDWDEMMMERDKRLTGRLRGQSVSQFLAPVRFCALLRGFVRGMSASMIILTCMLHLQTEVKAPAAFATNSIWIAAKPRGPGTS